MTLRSIRLFFALLLSILVMGGVAPPAQANNITPALVTESAAQPGSTVMLALAMKPAPGWHGYWQNPGDAGYPVSFEWTLPKGVTAGAPRYPVPQTLIISGLMNHVYERDYAILIPLTLAGDVKPGDALPIKLEASWLACTDKICVPERGHAETTLNIVAPGTNPAPDPRFSGWLQQIPAPLGAEAHFADRNGMLRLAIPLPANTEVRNPHFFVRNRNLVNYAAPQQFSRSGDILIAELKQADDPVSATQIDGVLRLNDAGDGLEITSTAGPVPPAGSPIDATPHLVWLILAALAGGLLLNAMPCVFPILSLKALSLARAGESQRQARQEGFAYTAGVIITCVALGAALLGLREAGKEIGWAFQLQEPVVVAALLLLASAITANLAGVFELSIPLFARAGNPHGAFATGILAAFVATPCTGPFMALAMGAALLMPVGPALLLFAMLGLGIALPFLAIAVLPPLRRMLPRPGPWMERLRRWLAIPMGLTALALIWLTYRLGGPGFALACVTATGVLMILFALIGKRQRRGGRAAPLAWGALAATAIALAITPMTTSLTQTRANGVLPAQPWSAETLAEARRDGKPVFAWFTADWCLTCKVNEEIAIEREQTRAAFAKAGVVILRGDWTQRDPAITRYLTEHGAAGVPFYMWYPANSTTGRQLPQILTAGTLTSLVNE